MSVFTLILRFAAGVTALVVGNGLTQADDKTEFFSAQVEPILRNRCYGCHSHETGEMKGGLTLDSRSGWEVGGDTGPAVLPGNLEKSLLITAIERRDLEMPPDEPLPAPEIELLKKWVTDGAVDPRVTKTAAPPTARDWWAAQPLQRHPAPSLGEANPVDAFLRQKLIAEGLDFSLEATRPELIRRLTFDLHGLPPTPDKITAFVADTDPLAYEHLVDRLLASPRFGERFARLWLDVAHFGESNGFGMDRPRHTAWPYRDYVIEAFNRDVPYSRFVQDQVAADVLFPEEPDKLPALGFLAAGPFNQSALAEQTDGTLCKKIALNLDRDDMVTTVASSFLSLTLHCARCHDHKFDPLTQDDYYGMQAVFAGAIRGERPFGPPDQVREIKHWKAVQQQVQSGQMIATFDPATQDTLRTRSREIAKRLSGWEQRWTLLDTSATQESKPSVAAEKLEDGSWQFATTDDKDSYTFTATASGKPIAAIRLEALSDEKLPNKGPGLQPQNGNFALTEFKVSIASPDRPSDSQPLAIKSAIADFNQAGWSIDMALDGKPETGWSIDPQEGRSHVAVFKLAEVSTPPAGSILTIRVEQTYGRQHVMGRLRLAVAEAAVEDSVLPSPDVAKAIGTVPLEGDPFAGLPPEAATALLKLAVEERVQALPVLPVVFAAGGDAAGYHNYQRPATPYPIHKLARGDVARPGVEMKPGGMTAMPVAFQMPTDVQPDDGARRAALARWLTDPLNPLPLRSIANRLWGWHFGTGIVSTPNDFGRMGQPPSHPELLDFLACELRDNGGSLKALHRLLVTSRAYRQSSRSRAEAAGKDSDNRWLWKMPRKRLEAEQIRDGLLLISGRLDPTMGGPSAMQFHYDDPNKDVSPQINYQKFDVDSPASRRRAVYRFVFRNVNDPFLETFDVPDPSLSVGQRANTTTPLQALSLANNAFVLRQCEWFARKLIDESPTLDGQIERAYWWLYGRAPTTDETRRVSSYAQSFGLENTLRVLVNSNEFLFVP
jgi:hypothetical protein